MDRTYRTGRSVGITLYRDDRCIGSCINATEAEQLTGHANNGLRFRRVATRRADRLAARIAAIETARRRENDRWAETLRDLLNLTDPQPAGRCN
jgi:hypothetical protein